MAVHQWFGSAKSAALFFQKLAEFATVKAPRCGGKSTG
jgi:hypothetical protein